MRGVASNDFVTVIMSLIGVLLTVISALALGAVAGERSYRVQWVGEQRRVVHEGNLAGQISLETLIKLPHLYALGPMEGLKGEVSIFDGLPFITRIQDRRIVVDRSFHYKACFLVYAQVDRWHKLSVPQNVRTVKEVEQFVWQAAAVSLDTSKPFPFLLKGKAALVQYHIVNKTDGLPHNPDQHEKVKYRFALKDQAVEMVGFCSDKHRGVFTPPNSKIHMHVRTLDGTAGGHVDDLQLNRGMTLFLPVSDGK
ncbi:MAG: acetolactate decarboxylase [Deltaproteobacteria bacterium]|nr:acetolactate decarboxylase [Deltaproteobacteria bacterium]